MYKRQLVIFARAQVDVAVLEVGLGGRLDAVNAVEPVLTMISSIGLDHQAYLGDTLTEIAGEKAAVMRADVPCVASVQVPEVEAVILTVAQDKGAPLHWVEPVAQESLPAWLGGAFTKNAALALEALRQMPAPWGAHLEADALEGLRWPGRRDAWTQGGRRWWLDVAHNPEGMKTLVAFLRESQAHPVFGVLGVMRDKDVVGVCEILANLPGVSWIATCAETPRALEAEILADHLRQAGADVVAVCPKVEEALSYVAKQPQHAQALCCGSVYLLGEVLSLWEVPPSFFALSHL